MVRQPPAVRPKRLFVAAFVSPAVEQHLTEHLDGVRTAHTELRWVRPDRWHVTLEFIGECGGHEEERQRERWGRRAARVEPFELSLSGAGAFPNEWNAKVVWIGLGGDVASYRGLAAAGQQPHVTLARTRTVADLTGLVDELATYRGPSWTVDRIALVESHLRRSDDRGPRYHAVDWFALGS